MKFVNPDNVVAFMDLKPGAVVADLGSGSGFYVLAAAKLIGGTGKIYAVDVQQVKLTVTQSISVQRGYSNVQTILADLDRPFSGIPEGSCDAVMLASILHEVTNRSILLENVYRLLKTGGQVLAVEWKPEQSPFGPAMEKRVSPEQLESEMNKLGLRKTKTIPADSYHYALLFQK